MELVHLRDAARQLGVSYPTLKQWIYRGRIKSVKTPGGHHRISQAEIESLLFREGRGRSAKNRPAQPRPRVAVESGLEHFISGRNQLVGRVIQLETVGLLSKVALDIGGQAVTAIITRDAVHDLKLKVGETVAALIKATEVMIIRPVTGKTLK